MLGPMEHNQSHPGKTGFPPLLHLTYHLQQLADDRLSREAGLGLSQARIMSTLSFTPVSQRAIAVALGQTEANVSRQLRVIKRAGLVSITKNKKDGRQRDVILTTQGQDKYYQAEEVLLKMEKTFEKQIKISL